MDVKDITALPELAGIRAPAAAPASGAKGSESFSSVLKSSLAEVNQLQQKADQAITALATGDKASLHDTMIAMEQADVSFRLMMQVRNKIVDAYQEIMRMQV
jgi:flagellar hook-basal body complex protein FliE